jgi:nucleotide-binding universal stress UspA family protein
MVIRMKLKKILVAIDGSDASEMALDYAIEMAKAFSGSLTILTVQEPLTPAPPPTMPPAIVESYMKEVVVYYDSIIEKALNRVKESRRKIETKTKIAKGVAWERIVEECRSGGHDIVIIGSRGLGGWKGLFLGSVSKRVVEEAPCPVLIVKGGAEK